MGSSKVRRRSAFVGIWFLPAEKESLEGAAQVLGVSVGALVRASVQATHGVEIDELA